MNQDKPTLNIRPATLTDIPFIQHIAATTWPVAYGSIISQAQLDYMLDMMYGPAALEKQMQEQHYFFLAFLSEQLAGFAAFSQLEGPVYKLHKLYVLPDIQQGGIGAALINTAETVAKTMGASQMQLNVNRLNKAKGFYEKHGYRVLRQDDIDIGGGFFMNDFIMEKML